MKKPSRKSEVYRMLEEEAPAAIIGDVEHNGFVIPLVDIYNHPEAMGILNRGSWWEQQKATTGGAS